ncbi:MAG TPA: hypothetical protein D7I07_04255 [Candidatus Poseidoniales archaeon]|nr:MAG TPA: hypothetical protein D7I07_04255 [Candidatus Poseidoniales archaeon]
MSGGIMAKKRSIGGFKSNRKNKSLDVQQSLISIIVDIHNTPILRQSATQKLLALNRKHRLEMPKYIGVMICKKCQILYNSKNSSTRIKHGQIIKTCHVCQDVRRLGGGPKHHRG